MLRTIMLSIILFRAATGLADTQQDICKAIVSPQNQARLIAPDAEAAPKDPYDKHLLPRCQYKFLGRSTAGRSMKDSTTVSFECTKRTLRRKEISEEVLFHIKKLGYETVDGLGRGAVQSMGDLFFWDRDTPCKVRIVQPGDLSKLIELARIVERTFSPGILRRLMKLSRIAP